jgi:hypothetical protein
MLTKEASTTLLALAALNYYVGNSASTFMGNFASSFEGSFVGGRVFLRLILKATLRVVS